MKTFLILFCMTYFIQAGFSQCDCDKIRRADGIVTQCNPRPVGGDDNTQIGIALGSNEVNKFLTLTIRYLSNPAFKITGNLNVRFTDNYMATYRLINTQSSNIGNSNVENGLFLITEEQLTQIKYAKVMTISIELSDNKVHTYLATQNSGVLMEQARCL